jgi:quercetin dioxygenase-like cupin family protein
MFIRRLEDVQGTDRYKVVLDGALRSARYIAASDGMGFSLHVNRAKPCPPMTLWYKNHWEANYIVSGTGLLEDLATGQTWPLKPGVIYVVGPAHRHRFRADTDLHNFSFLNPPLLASDMEYDEDGSIGPTGDIPPGPGELVVMQLDELRAAGHEKVVAGGNVRSIRALTQEDQLGFTLCDVRLDAGNRSELWYKHHWEANIVLDGQGTVTDLSTDESWPLAPEAVYVVGPDDRHSVESETDLHLLSLFNPPLQGDEQHDEEGTLPPSGPLPPGMRENIV